MVRRVRPWTTKAFKVGVFLAAGAIYGGPKGWSFAEVSDERIPLADLKVGEEMDARIKKPWRMFGWFVDIGATKDAFMEFEEGCDGFPADGINTWRKGASLSVRILDLDVDRIYLTTRNGPLERPPRFRRSPTAEDVESYGNVDANEIIDTSVCGMSPGGIWLRVPSRNAGEDFRTLLRLEDCEESVKETARLGMTVPVRVTGIDREKKRVLVTMMTAKR
eukprot:s47_g32.t1